MRFLGIQRSDFIALVLMVVLWFVFFGRVLTPDANSRFVPAKGDFYGQFVTFSAYQFDRFSAGEIPLWNPYNNGGFPFVADTQSAAFYPPRLMAIAIASLAGGWSVTALLLEGLFHFLISALGWYAFLRVLTAHHPLTHYAAFAGSIVATYGGYLTGYPLLQLAILESAVWLPFALLAITMATADQKTSWVSIVFGGCALGLSWMAGHPQTAWFCTVLAIAFLFRRGYEVRTHRLIILMALGLLGAVTFGITAITFVPGVEYLRYTTRSDLPFSSKANGFPLLDTVQLLLPSVVSLFSPLYVGVIAFLLALFAVVKTRAARFWGVAGLIALLLSFGGNTPFYGWLYALPTGLSFFRGQERAAFVVSMCLAVLVAYSVLLLNDAKARRIFGIWVAGSAIAFFVFCVGCVLLPTGPNLLVGGVIGFISTAVVSVGCWRVVRVRNIAVIVCSTIIGELFFVGMTSNEVFVPSSSVADVMHPSLLLQQVIQTESEPFRVDGFRGLRDNYGSVFGVMDIRGISPLFLTSAERIIYKDYSHNRLAWELFAVRYVFSDRTSFSTPTTVLGEGTDSDGAIILHKLVNARPFAHLVYKVDTVDSDEFAWALLNDPRYELRDNIILNAPIRQTLPQFAPTDGKASVTIISPENISIEISTSENAILSLAMLDYPGWTARLDSQPRPILRAYGGLMAIEIPAGEYTLQLTYRPLSVIIGAIISIFTWGGVMVLALWNILRKHA